MEKSSAFSVQIGLLCILLFSMALYWNWCGMQQFSLNCKGGYAQRGLSKKPQSFSICFITWFWNFNKHCMMVARGYHISHFQAESLLHKRTWVKYVYPLCFFCNQILVNFNNQFLTIVAASSKGIKQHCCCPFYYNM